MADEKIKISELPELSGSLEGFFTIGTKEVSGTPKSYKANLGFIQEAAEEAEAEAAAAGAAAEAAQSAATDANGAADEAFSAANAASAAAGRAETAATASEADHAQAVSDHTRAEEDHEASVEATEAATEAAEQANALEQRLESGNFIPALAENLHTIDVKVNETFDGGDDTSEENESDNFNMRTTAGDMTISNGVSEVKGMSGRSIVWNQLAKNGNFSDTSEWSIREGAFSVANHIATLTQERATFTNAIYQDRTFVANHTYLISVVAKKNQAATTQINVGLANTFTSVEKLDVPLTPDFARYSTIVTLAQSAGRLVVSIASYKTGELLGIDFQNLQIIDLTQMFGSDAAICSALGVANLDTDANEAKAIENFERLFPKDYYAYDAGSLKSFNPTSFTASGYNWFNPQNYLDGYGITNGVVTADATKKLAYCKIVKSTIGVGYNNGFTIHTENEVVSKTAFSKSVPVAGASVSNEASASGKSIPFAVNTDSEGYLVMECTNTADICVHPKWSQDVADHFEAWNPSVAHIDVSEIVDGDGNSVFPYGLLSAGSVRDEVKDGKATKRIGVVDLGTLSWNLTSGTTYSKFTTQIVNYKPVSSPNLIPNLLIGKYVTKTYTSVGSGNAENNVITSTGTFIAIMDSAYSDTATFKAAMSGVLLFYELATPIEYDLPSSWQPQYICNDYGFERFETDDEPQIMPYSASFAYSRDLKGELRNHLDRHSDEWLGRNEFNAAMANKANTSGAYPNLVAGNLVDAKGAGSAHEFVRRTSCGNDSIADDGTALIKKVKGNTIVWNQLVHLSDGTDTLGGVTVRRSSGGNTIKGSGTTTSSSGGYAIATLPTMPIGHKFYVRVLGSFSGFNFVGVKTYGTANYPYSLPFKKIDTVTGNAASDRYLTLSWSAGVEISIDMHFDVFDLTQMFGAGNEPSTVEEFEALFPNDYYAYNAGQLLSVKADGIVTDGFNQWDEEWEEGQISTATGQNIVAASQIRSKNYIPVFPNTNYYGKKGNATYLFACWYDAEKNYIGYASIWSGAMSPANAAYMRFYSSGSPAYGPTYLHDICINLSWSGIRNGEYEEHWKDTMPLPIAAKFTPADWLPLHAYAVGELVVYDDKMYKCTTATSAEEDTFDTTKFTLIRAAGIGEMLSAGNVHDELTEDGMTIAIGVRDYEEGDESDTSVVTDMTHTNYPLAEPIVILFSEVEKLNLSYKVADFGTEEVSPQGVDDDGVPVTAPFRADIKYSDDFTRQLVNMKKNYQSQDSMDTMLSALGTALGFTYTKTWDETNGKWNYSFTMNSNG